MWLQVIRLLSIPFKAPPAETEKYFFDVNCYVSSAVAVRRSLIWFSYTAAITDCWNEIRFLHTLDLVACNVTLVYVFGITSKNQIRATTITFLE